MSRSLENSFPGGRADLTARQPPVSRRRGHAAISHVCGVGQLDSRRTTLLLTMVELISFGPTSDDSSTQPRVGLKIVANKA